MGKLNIKNKKNEPSQRQLRVGEELRHVLATVLRRNESIDPMLDSLSITVSEVRISPDLRNATAYVAPLGGENGDDLVDMLNERAGAIRRQVTSQVHLKYSPKLRFKLDQSFEQAEHIDRLLKSPEVARDIYAPDDMGGGER